MRRKRASKFCSVVLGLVSITLHASVLWHPSPLSRTQPADPQLLADLGETICHGGRVSESNEAPADRDAPVPKADCLFCSGFASASLAILSGTGTEPLARASSRIGEPVSLRAVASARLFAPRSRGPPRPA